ncbi:uncharacterized protein LOC133520788 [Cydia pomonella]|uniref:uncharacterized protein LOC133520788 n=1 Tax=Cydia pomonella TaxID=82600 RepID=UPI002ADDB9F8|nr:uncharacterized protein LOC133520788 [Cydia pomonella]
MRTAPWTRALRTDSEPILVDGQEVQKCGQYKYLGSIVHDSGLLEMNIQHRIAAAWLKWTEVTGVTCDSKMPIKMKGLVYTTIIRPVLTYGSEIWPMTQRHVQAIHVAEMKMLRWMSGVSRINRVRNEHIRGSLGVRDVSDKLQESRLRWFGHVKRRPPEYVGNKALSFALPGPNRRGKPRQRWRNVIAKDLNACGLSENDVQDRVKWKEKSRKADPVTVRDKR